MLRIEHFALTPGKIRVMVIEEMQIANGKKVLVFGDNQVGKTFFLQAVHGSHSQYAGTIQYKGKSNFFKKKEASILIENTAHVIPGETLWKNVTIPFGKISKRQKIKIFELLKSVDLSEKIGQKQQSLSVSETKLAELVRAVIQLPHLILIDDLDTYFDEKNYLKAMNILQYAVSNGTIVLATAKRKLELFDDYYREQDKKVVKL
ncbi:MAG TPA: ATP-binding cassette domain-containing protein [Candidatus Cloacimonadota bacterium]|nr:ATP-binding cassette domain-containing protein [Candidatus Cloacimonadota bacterium]